MRYLTIIFLFFALSFYLYSQSFLFDDSEIGIKNITIDYQPAYFMYSGNYHFGFSESESNLEIKVKGKSISSVFSYGEWNSKINGWNKKIIVLKNVKIIGNIFLAEGWCGIFVNYKRTNDNSYSKGLLLYCSTSKIKNELGWKTSY